jgi:hypothetical protein
MISRGSRAGARAPTCWHGLSFCRRDRGLTDEDLLREHAVNLGIPVVTAIGDHHETVVGVCGVADSREHDVLKEALAAPFSRDGACRAVES